MSTEILYSAKISFRNKGKIKNFIDKPKLEKLLPANLYYKTSWGSFSEKRKIIKDENLNPYKEMKRLKDYK